MSITIALAGDTMLGRGVAERLATDPPSALFSDEVIEAARSADLMIVNLECCISTRGRPWPAPRKPFFFRAPPSAVEALALLDVDCVTLANNHALDYGYQALADTLEHLRAGGIGWTGAGPNLAAARSPCVLEAGGGRVAVLGATDHPTDFAAGEDRPGVAYADFRSGAPAWLRATIEKQVADFVVVTPHWGPNMSITPPSYVAAAAPTLLEHGADLVAGHSAHVFHGADPPILYDLGDFIDDYAVDPILRNDLGLLWFATFDPPSPLRLEVLPLELGFCHTRLATGRERAWILARLASACDRYGWTPRESGGRVMLQPSSSAPAE